MAQSSQKDKLYIVILATDNPKTQPYDIVFIEKCKNCEPTVRHTNNIHGGQVHPAARVASGGRITRPLTYLTASKFCKNELHKVDEITREQFDALLEKNADGRRSLYDKMQTGKWRPPQRSIQSGAEVHSISVGPSETDIFLATDNVEISSGPIYRGVLFMVKQSGNIYDAVTKTELNLLCKRGEKIWEHPAVEKVPKTHLEFLQQCDDRVSVFLSGQLELVDKAERGNVQVVVIEDTIPKKGCVVKVLNDEGKLSVEIDGKPETMTIENVFDVDPPKWVKEKKRNHGTLYHGDRIHLSDIGFGSFRCALTLPGQSAPSCVAQLLTKEFLKDTDVPKCLRPYVHELVDDPNLAVVHPFEQVSECEFYVLKENWMLSDGSYLPKNSLLAWNFNHELFDIRSQMPLGVFRKLFGAAELVDAKEVATFLLTENSAEQVVDREVLRTDFHRGNQEDVRQNEEAANEGDVPDWVVDAITDETDHGGWRKNDVIEIDEDAGGQQFAYGIVKVVWQSKQNFPLVAAELLTPAKNSSEYLDAVRPFLSLWGVDPGRAIVRPAGEFLNCKIYILLKAYDRRPVFVPEGSLLAWNSSKLLRAIDWQTEIGYLNYLGHELDIQEVTPQQLPFLFRIDDGSQRLAVHRSDFLGRLVQTRLPLEGVLFLRKSCDSDHLQFGEFGAITRYEDGYVFVQVDGEKEEKKTHLGRVCDLENPNWKVYDPRIHSGASVTFVQGDSCHCGTVLGVFRLPWHKEDVVIVQLLIDDVGAAAVPETILRRLFPSEEYHRAAAYFASAVKKGAVQILLRDLYSKNEVAVGSLIINDNGNIFCIDLETDLGKKYLIESDMTEVSPHQLPFLFRIEDGSQRLAVHESGIVDRLVQTPLPLDGVLFLREDCDSVHLQFGEVGAITRLEDGFVFVQVDGEKKEKKTHLGRICDLEHPNWKKENDPHFYSGASVTIVQADSCHCGTVLGVFRLPWYKEDVVIVQLLMDDVGAAAVPETILRRLFPSEECHRAAAYLASAVKRCEFCICIRSFKSFRRDIDIPNGSLLAKCNDSSTFFLDFALDLGNEVVLSSDTEKVSEQQIPFLLRINDTKRRFAVHRSGLPSHLLRSSLPLERVLFFPKGFDADHVSFFVNCVMTRYEDGFVIVQILGKDHRTTLDHILILEDRQDTTYYPSTHGKIKPGDIVDVEKSYYENVIQVGKILLWTIRMIHKFPGQSESSAIVEILQDTDNISGEVRRKHAVCPVKALTKVSSLKDKGACAQSFLETNDGSTMVDYYVVESSIGVPSADPGRGVASATYASDAHVPREKSPVNYELDSIKNDDTCGTEVDNMDVDENYMTEESGTQPMDISDSETEKEKEKTDEFFNQERDQEKVNIHEKKHLLGTSETGENQNREEDRRGMQRRTSESAPRTADEVADEDEGKEPPPSGEETASGDDSTGKTHSFVEEKIDHLPLESRVCFLDDSSSKLLAGTVKWTGKSHIVYAGAMMAVVVLDQRHKEGTNGCFSGKRLLTCPSGRALLIGTDRLQKIPQVRCGDVVETILKPRDRGRVVKVEAAEGKSATLTVVVDCGSGPRSAKSMVVKQFKTHEVRIISEGRRGAFSPWKMKVLGERRGIQGEGNSCYLDSLLFSLFAFSDAAKEKVENASKKGEWFDQTYDALIKKIVTVLRSSGYVPSAAVKSLRRLMADASKEEKFKDSSRDIPECMETLFQKMLELQPFVTIRSSNNVTGTFVVETLLVEGVDTVTSQMCLEYAAMHMDFVLSSVDDCIMIQLPRDRANYSVVIPSKTLSLRWCQGVTDKSQCSRCNSQSVTHLDPTLFDRQGLRSTFLCSACAKYRRNATSSHFLLQDGASGASWVTSMPELHLSAVICIESSHYNAFVRTGSTDPEWVFFDSMADQKQERTNIPKIQAVNVDDWLDEASAVDKFDKAAVNQYKKEPADIYKRLFQYPYMFIYHT